MATGHLLDVSFRNMTEPELRRWVEANPSLVNSSDGDYDTPLYVAANVWDSVELVRWLVLEKGADTNTADDMFFPILGSTKSVDVLEALLDCGADPIEKGRSFTPLCMHIMYGRDDMVARLLEDPRVQASVDLVCRGFRQHTFALRLPQRGRTWARHRPTLPTSRRQPPFTQVDGDARRYRRSKCATLPILSLSPSSTKPLTPKRPLSL